MNENLRRAVEHLNAALGYAETVEIANAIITAIESAKSAQSLLRKSIEDEWAESDEGVIDARNSHGQDDRCAVCDGDVADCDCAVERNRRREERILAAQ